MTNKRQDEIAELYQSQLLSKLYQDESTTKFTNHVENVLL